MDYNDPGYSTVGPYMIPAPLSHLIRNPNFTNITSDVIFCHCNDISKMVGMSSYAPYNFFVIIITVPIVATFGLITNIFNFVMFSKPPLALISGNVYLAALAISDFFVVFTGLFLIWMDSARTYVPFLSDIFIKSLPILTFGNMAQTCSVYFTVGAATDCFVKVCCSSSASKFWNRPKMAISVITIIILSSIAYNAVQFWTMFVQHCISTVTLKAQFEICPTELLITINEAYNVYATAILLAFLPFLLLCILNGLIIFRVQALKSMSTSARAQHRGSRLSGDDTVTMIMVIVVFLLCNILGLVINILETFTNTDMVIIHYMADMSNLLVTFNSSLNFVIYICFDKSYRTIFVQRVCNMPGITPIGSPIIRYDRSGVKYSMQNGHFVPVQDAEENVQIGEEKRLVRMNSLQHIHTYDVISSEFSLGSYKSTIKKKFGLFKNNSYINNNNNSNNNNNEKDNFRTKKVKKLSDSKNSNSANLRNHYGSIDLCNMNNSYNNSNNNNVVNNNDITDHSGKLNFRKSGSRRFALKGSKPVAVYFDQSSIYKSNEDHQRCTRTIDFGAPTSPSKDNIFVPFDFDPTVHLSDSRKRGASGRPPFLSSESSDVDRRVMTFNYDTPGALYGDYSSKFI